MRDLRPGKKRKKKLKKSSQAIDLRIDTSIIRSCRVGENPAGVSFEGHFITNVL
jgi:hypothetical protein